MGAPDAMRSSWLTVAWSVSASMCLTFALVHLVIWLQRRRDTVYLLCSLTALGAAVTALLELLMWHATTMKQFVTGLYWSHVPIFVMIVCMLSVVRGHLGTGNRRLALAVAAAWTLLLALNLASPDGMILRQTTRLSTVSAFWGATFVVAEGVRSPWWALVAGIADVLLLVFVVDVFVALRRQDRGSRAARIGGMMTFGILAAIIQSHLVDTGLLRMPYMVSFAFLGFVAAMTYDLGSEVVRAARLAEQLQVREAEAREAERRMSLFIDAANQVLWVWDIPRNEVWVSESGLALFGWPPSAEVNLERFIAAVHPDDREASRLAVQRAFDGQGDYAAEFRMVLPDGTIRWIAGRGRVEFNGNGKPALMRGVSLDITERKVAEEALRESETRFRTMANTAPVMIWMSGTDSLCTFFNRGWLDFTGRTLEQELGSGWAEGVHPEDTVRCLRVYASSFDARLPFTMEYRLRRHDGEYRWILDSGVPRYAPDDAFLGYIGSCIDITERRQAELELARQRDELAHLSRVSMLGELSGAVAHELNQPLAAILSNAQAAGRILAHDPADLDEVQDILRDIAADDRRAGEVIHRLRLLLMKGEVHHQPLDVNELVQDVLKLVHSDLMLNAVTAQSDLSPALGAVSGDRVQIHQVLLNLIMNACSAMREAATAERTLIVRTESTDGEGVHVSVVDRGRGIPPEHVDRIFEPFFTTRAQGMGLGLAVCRTIIGAHGGRLWATNNPGDGATVHFSLPLARVGREASSPEPGRSDAPEIVGKRAASPNPESEPV